jgi:hypothetical protein
MATSDGASAGGTGGAVRRPVVWPVFLAFVAALFVSALLTGLVLFYSPWARPLTHLLLAAGVSSATFFVAAVAGLAPWRVGSARELGLTPPRIPWARVPLVCLGLLGLSQAIESAATLLGLGSVGSVGEMTHMVASASAPY